MRNTTMQQNVGSWGGGLALSTANLEAAQCNWKQNQALLDPTTPGSATWPSVLTGTHQASTENVQGGGGALYSDGLNVLNLTDSVLESNAAGKGAYGPSLDGGGLFMNGGRLSARSTSFTGNHAARYGGGLFVAGGVVDLASVSFVRNAALSGGAVYSDDQENVTIRPSRLEGNTAVAGACVFGSAREPQLKFKRSVLKPTQNLALYAGDTDVGAPVSTTCISHTHITHAYHMRIKRTSTTPIPHFQATPPTFFSGDASGGGGPP
jgi:hypothetical protein